MQGAFVSCLYLHHYPRPEDNLGDTGVASNAVRWLSTKWSLITSGFGQFFQLHNPQLLPPVPLCSFFIYLVPLLLPVTAVAVSQLVHYHTLSETCLPANLTRNNPVADCKPGNSQYAENLILYQKLRPAQSLFMVSPTAQQSTIAS